MSHGEDRKYDVYIPNYLFLINNKTFSTGKGTIKDILYKIKLKNEKHAIRRKFESIISSIEIDLKLNLEPCQNCGTPRLNENSQFCHNCGTKLIAKNVLEELGKIPISKLPLTEWRRHVIKEQGIYKNINDYLADKNPLATLKQIKGIWNVKSEDIVQTIDTFIEDFLN
ncbi:MAG: zinc ribbon domain-containing protein [Saprospiraceae bacterium]|nr:zinc ribbon domain-containing protein [Saprospiraceae bacterium]